MYPQSRNFLHYPYPERARFFIVFESAVTDVILSGATTLLYIGGLVIFVAWLKKKKAAPRGNPIVERP